MSTDRSQRYLQVEILEHDTRGNNDSAPNQPELWPADDRRRGNARQARDAWREYASLPEYPALIPPTCHGCGGSNVELRFCRSNRGVGWQCRKCGSLADRRWIPHSSLVGVDIGTLPEWARR
jgi:hypothetical protein